MIIALLSDSHGSRDITRRAIDILKARGAVRFIHAGDVGDEMVLDLFAGEQLDFVWGNNDNDRSRLARYARSLGLTCHDVLAKLSIAGKTLIVTHGDQPLLLRQSLSNPRVNYLITGHTHVPLDARRGGIRHINPGALYRARVKTVATLDLSADKLDIVEVAAS